MVRVHALRGGDSEVHIGPAQVDHIVINDFWSIMVDIKNFKVKDSVGHVVEGVIIIGISLDLEDCRA